MSSVHQISQCVVDLNNDALSHFLNGDYDHALEVLRIAYDIFEAHRQKQSASRELRSVSTTFPQGSSSLESMRGGSASNNFSMFNRSTTVGFLHQNKHMSLTTTDYPYVLQSTGTTSTYGNVKKRSLTSLPEAAHSMYNRAMVLADNQGREPMSAQNQQRIGAIILYNLALIHHNIGLHLGMSPALWQALRLYERALETLDSGASFNDAAKLLLAILNNMGNIHAHLFNYESTWACMNKLRLALAASNSALALDEDYLFFFLNALFQVKELCFAPAA